MCTIQKRICIEIICDFALVQIDVVENSLTLCVCVFPWAKNELTKKKKTEEEERMNERPNE